MAREQSIQHGMLINALEGITNDNTIRAYKHDVKEFAIWARSQGFKSYEDVLRKCAAQDAVPLVAQKDNLERLVQRYRDEYVLQKTSSPATEHRKITAVCQGLRISSKDIVTTKRSADRIIRGRDTEANRVGNREARQTKYSRLIEVQSAVGIRRAELARLRGKDLVQDESGYLCVRVEHGKGGKSQLQRILPGDEIKLKAVFDSVEPDSRVFRRSEISNHINLHAIRAEHAKDAYQYYLNRCASRDGRIQLAQEIAKRFRTCHERGSGTEKFIRELKRGIEQPEYYLRGANREKAERLGLPIVYDRLALMGVSVFHLSHWRLDVTVTNYMIQ